MYASGFCVQNVVNYLYLSMLHRDKMALACTNSGTSNFGLAFSPILIDNSCSTLIKSGIRLCISQFPVYLKMQDGNFTVYLTLFPYAFNTT